MVCTFFAPVLRANGHPNPEHQDGSRRSSLRTRSAAVDDRAVARGSCARTGDEADRTADRRRRRGLATEQRDARRTARRSEEHTSELQSLMRITDAVFCLKKQNIQMNLTRQYYP